MPPEACRLAVQAMDAADERWTVADVLRDANAKVEVLSRFTSEVSQRAIGAAAQAEADRLAIDKNLVEAESTIQAQIAALQAELESFRTEAAAERARVDAQLTTIQEAVARESARVQSEIARLGRVRTFLDPLVNAGGGAAAPGGAPGAQAGAPSPGRTT
jgi:vacuolar-type H+-ATPase subunit I/STV1